MDSDKNGGGLGLPVLVALCGSLLGRNTRGGTIIAGRLNLGGSTDLISNAIRIAELAIDKQAQTLLMPVAARRLERHNSCGKPVIQFSNGLWKGENRKLDITD